MHLRRCSQHGGLHILTPLTFIPRANPGGFLARRIFRRHARSKHYVVCGAVIYHQRLLSAFDGHGDYRSSGSFASI